MQGVKGTTTPGHYVRVEQQLWDKAKAKARNEGTTLSERINNFLIDYTADV